MIPINDPAFHKQSMSALASFVDRSYKGRVVQIFLAAKFHGDAFPKNGEGIRITVGDFQYFLDDFYRRLSRSDDVGSIAIIFKNNYLIPSGKLAPGLTVASNIWRNNLGIQKAVICYAPEVELQDSTFVQETRLNCPYFVSAGDGLKEAGCQLWPGAHYRGEDGPKLIHRSPFDEGYAIVQPDNINLWNPVVRSQGKRLPVLPLVSALYYDAAIAAGRISLDPLEFMLDFNFTEAEYHSYFDDDLAQADNAALAALRPDLDWSQLVRPLGSGVVMGPSPLKKKLAKKAKGLLDPNDLPELPPSIDPPAGGHWWSAERGVADHLRSLGWKVIDRTRQVVGFDFEIVSPDGTTVFYIEVKSSAGTCRPQLTETEHESAKRHASKYVLAIVEDFHPDKPLRVYWVRNPAKLEMSPRPTKVFVLARSKWLRHYEQSLHPPSASPALP